MIIFAEPGLGKSCLVKQDSRFIDCDTIIENLLESPEKRYTVHELCNSGLYFKEYFDWAKTKIYSEWLAKYSDKILLAGKFELIQHADFVFMHSSIAQFKQRVSSPERSNPITTWNYADKHNAYIDEAKRCNKQIIYTKKYLADIANAFVRELV